LEDFENLSSCIIVNLKNLNFVPSYFKVGDEFEIIHILLNPKTEINL